MPSRKKAAPRESDTELSFEEALEGLESIVESMENEQLPLEDLVAYYEKGSKLMAHCESVLGSAKERIELITLRSQGESKLENGAAHDDGSDTPSSANADESENDDIRLF